MKPDDKQQPKKTLIYKIGRKCPLCNETYTAFHWTVHDPDGVEGKTRLDNWP